MELAKLAGGPLALLVLLVCASAPTTGLVRPAPATDRPSPGPEVAPPPESMNRTRRPQVEAQTSVNPQVAAAKSSSALQVQANSLTGVRLKWRQMERSIGESMGARAGELKQTIGDLLLDKRLSGLISSQCKLSLDELLAALAEQRLWAGQMLDSSGRLPVGLLEGTLTELGNFDECLAISQPAGAGQLAAPATSGQYCSLQIKPPLLGRPRLHTACNSLPSFSGSPANQTLRLVSQHSHHFYYAGLRLGICTPDRCSQADLQHLLSAYLSRFELVGQVKSCQVRRQAKPPPSAGPLDQLLEPLGQLDLVQQWIL